MARKRYDYLERLSQLNPANVINWQEVPHRVCDRLNTENHRVQLLLAPETISEGADNNDKDKKIFHERDCFWTRPIGSAISVKVLSSHSKIEKLEKRHRR